MLGSQVATCIEEADSGYHEIDHSEKTWNLILEFQIHVLLEETYKPSLTKYINKFFSQVFIAKFFVSHEQM